VFVFAATVDGLVLMRTGCWTAIRLLVGWLPVGPLLRVVPSEVVVRRVGLFFRRVVVAVRVRLW
jgi:hypothetical protein